MKKFLVLGIMLCSTSALAWEWPKSRADLSDLWTKIKVKIEQKIAEYTGNAGDGNRLPASEQQQVANGNSSQGSERKEIADWKTAVQKVKEVKLSRPVAPAVPSKDTRMTLNKQHVPSYDLAKFKKLKISKIPLLDVGTEAVLDTNMFEPIQMMPFPKATFEKFELPYTAALSQEQFTKESGAPVAVVASVEKIPIPVLTADKKVTSEKINQIVFTALPTSEWSDLAVTQMSAEDLKLLRGLILYDKKDLCHIAAGIFADLTNSSNPAVKVSSEFHLGACLHVMNLPTEAQYYLDKVIKAQNPDFTSEAIKISMGKIKRYQEADFVEMMANVNEKFVPKELTDDLHYLKAKYYVRKGKYEQAQEWAGKISKSSDKYYKGAFITALASYFLGKHEQAIAQQKKLVEELQAKDNDKELLALSQIQLGRMLFQKGKFKDSMEYFQQVGKDNTLWIQALTEQGWAQLQAKDAGGAIGNMHSIQSPFFESVYKPESYIVRSIGYLTICQYADAYKTLAYLEKKYQPWLEKLASFNKTHTPSTMYGALIKFIEGQGKVSVENMPPQMLKEVARQKDFLNAQESINALIDENSGYPFIQSIVEKDKKSLTTKKAVAQQKVTDLQLKIKNAMGAKAPQAKKNIGAWKAELESAQDFLTVYDFKMATYNEGAAGFKKLTPAATGRIAKIKNLFKDEAGVIAKNQFHKMERRLQTNFDNNELLKYEIFAGSGENLRYQVAGGKVVGMPKALERKLAAQNWDFDGEFWEDEIGHYRSAMKNNCKRE